jgi:ApeA N-terminal domain 1
LAAVEDNWRREGRFWLPGSDVKTFGHIEYDPDRGMAVRLLESPLSNDARWEAPAVEVLHGETLDGRLLLSLLDGEVIGPPTLTPGNFRTADVHFETLVEGDHVTSSNEATGTQAVVALFGLRDVLRGGGFGEALLSVTSDQPSVETASVDMPWGSLDLVVATMQTKWSLNETRTEVRAQAQMEFNEQTSLDAIDRAVEALQDFIVFSSGRPSYVEALEVSSPAKDPSASRPQRRPFKIVRRPSADVGRVRRGGLRPLILNPATLDEGADIVRTWFDLRDQLGPVWRLFFSTLVDIDLTPESLLLNLTAFAEGYHRTLHDVRPLSEKDAQTAVAAMLDAIPDDQREVFLGPLKYANSQSQRARIRWLAKRATEVIDAIEGIGAWDLDLRRFTSEVTDTRNWLTHWGDRGPHVQEGAELSRLASQLYLVLVVNILIDLGLDVDAAASQVATRLKAIGLP